MKTLTTAIMDRFKRTDNGIHTTLYTLVSGKMYKEQAKQKATLPYVVYHIISNVLEWNFCSDFEKTRIQFDLFSSANESTEVENMFAALKALYDWQPLVIENYDHVYTKRLQAQLRKDYEDDVWMYNVDYEIYMELQ